MVRTITAMTPDEKAERLAAIEAERAALLSEPDGDELPQVDDVAAAAGDVADAAASVASAAAEVADNATPPQPDVIDQAMADVMRIEAEAAAAERAIRAQQEADVARIAAERGAEVAVVEAMGEAMPDEPVAEDAPPLVPEDRDPKPSGRRLSKWWW
jgi:hypothetical protein